MLCLLYFNHFNQSKDKEREVSDRGDLQVADNVYREGEYAERLLLIGLRLLPASVLAAAHQPATAAATAAASDADMFTTVPKLDVYGMSSSRYVAIRRSNIVLV